MTPPTQPPDPTPRAVRLRLAAALVALVAGVAAVTIAIVLVHTTLS